MSEKLYKCSKCGRTHRYDSKIGVRHLQYRVTKLTKTEAVPIVKEPVKAAPKKVKDVSEKPEKVSHKKTGLIRGYPESYREGVKKFGIWWKVFQISIWSFVLIFLLTAVIILVVYLPKIEMINWSLR
jgi:hypothetical protein